MRMIRKRHFSEIEWAREHFFFFRWLIFGVFLKNTFCIIRIIMWTDDEIFNNFAIKWEPVCESKRFASCDCQLVFGIFYDKSEWFQSFETSHKSLFELILNFKMHILNFQYLKMTKMWNYHFVRNQKRIFFSFIKLHEITKTVVQLRRTNFHFVTIVSWNREKKAVFCFSIEFYWA